MLQATDKGTIRIIVVILGILALACVGGVIGLSATQTPIPDTLGTVTGLTTGAFIAFLTKTSSGAGAAEAVQALAAAKDAGLDVPPDVPGAIPAAPVEANLVVVPDDPSAGRGL